MSAVAERVREADNYLNARTGHYGYRKIRYSAAHAAMRRLGLDAGSTVVDVGCGWTELDYFLRVSGGWRGRYYPIDACLDGVELATWTPPRPAEFFVALEVVEHLSAPEQLLRRMQAAATRGVVISTPNPERTDVLGMDATHRSCVSREQLEALGFVVRVESFYGADEDSLFGVWKAPTKPLLTRWERNQLDAMAKGAA